MLHHVADSHSRNRATERVFRDQHTTLSTAPRTDRVLVALFATAGVIALPLGLAWMVARWLP